METIPTISYMQIDNPARFLFVNMTSTGAYDAVENNSDFTSAASGSNPSSVSKKLYELVIPKLQNERTVPVSPP